MGQKNGTIGWKQILAVLLVAMVGFGMLFGIIEVSHAANEASCDRAYGEQADWIGTSLTGDESRLICEMPNGTLRYAEYTGPIDEYLT